MPKGWCLTKPLYRIIDSTLPYSNPIAEDFTRSASILVFGLVIVIPLISISLDISLLFHVSLMAVVYLWYMYKSDRVFAGTASAFLVLSIFNANIPLARTEFSELDLLIADPLALVLLAFLLNDYREWFGHKKANTSELVAIGGFVLFTLWAFLSAIVSNGPSSMAALMFSLEQLRYFVFFVVAALLTKKTNVWCTVQPLMLSIYGNLVFAIAQVINGGSFHLTYLGDGPQRKVGSVFIGGIKLSTGLYPGAFIGHGRDFVGLLLILLPFLVLVSFYDSKWGITLSTFGIVGIMLIIRIADTDAGWMSAILILLLIGLLSGLMSFETKGNYYLRSALTFMLGIVMSGFFFLSRFFTSSNATEQPSTTERNGTQPEPTPTGANGSHPESTASSSLRELLADLFAQLPLIQTDTLSIRLHQYAAAVDLGLKYPLFGIGGDNFVLVADLYDLPRGMGIHNIFFAHFASLGFPGLVFYTMSIGAFLWIATYRLVKSKAMVRFLWASILTGFVGFHAYTFWVFAYNLSFATTGFWIVSGIVVGSERPTD